MSMGRSITPSEELRAGMVEASKTPCNVCKAPCWGECDNCYAPMCDECAVKCAGCPQDNERCLACAIRNGYVEINGKQWCENCQPEEEGEMEMLRR